MNLQELRFKIDAIDDEIIELIIQRMAVIKEVGELKRTEKSVVYRPEREREIIERLYSQSNKSLTKPAIEAIFLEIFAVSRMIELPEKIAYLGPEGSFTHQVAESRFGDIGEYISLQSIKGVFDSVSSGRTTFGVVPIENNQAGSVKETIAHLAERDVNIVSELSEPIHFCLASLESSTKDIKAIYSKDMAFHQCEEFLRENFNDDIELITVESTSTAAKLASQQPNTAALCSIIASKVHRVPILYFNVEDTADNRTRFLIIARQFNNQQSGNDKTSIILKQYNDDRPGNLVAMLNHFKENDVNLTKIESWPAKSGEQFTYFFFIDFDGHVQDENVARVLETYPNRIKILGSYVKNI